MSSSFVLLALAAPLPPAVFVAEDIGVRWVPPRPVSAQSTWLQIFRAMSDTPMPSPAHIAFLADDLRDGGAYADGPRVSPQPLAWRRYADGDIDIAPGWGERPRAPRLGEYPYDDYGAPEEGEEGESDWMAARFLEWF